MTGYFSKPGDFKKWLIAYHNEQTNEERWRGFQITYTQAPDDKVEKVSPLKYTLNFMLKFNLGLNICEANSKMLIITESS